MFAMNKTVAVTGGTGYIAGFIIAEFLNHGYEVRASVRDLAKVDAVKKGLSGWVEDGACDRLTAFEADLTSPAGWGRGFDGVDGVIHVASPLGNGTESADELIQVAQGGTLHVLQGAVDGGVKRVVMTSSGAACTPRVGVGEIVLDENFWSDTHNHELDPYRLSKIASERAAWAFAKDKAVQLTTILPGAVFGPIMRPDVISGDEILLRLLNGGMPASVKVPLEVSDVRDVAALHRLAFENDAAIGQRFLASSTTITMPQVAKLYREHFPVAKAPKAVFPNWMVRLLAVFIPSLRQLVPMLGRQYRHTTQKAETLLGWTHHTPQETVLDAAQSLIDHGLVTSISPRRV